VEPGELRNLPGVQNRKQRPVDDQCLWIPDQLGHHLSTQGCQESSPFPDAAVKRGRVKTYHSGKKVREESFVI
jgi:hypothetical protein